MVDQPGERTKTGVLQILFVWAKQKGIICDTEAAVSAV